MPKAANKKSLDKLIAKLNEALGDADTLQTTAQDEFENMSETKQESEYGEQLTTADGQLDEAKSYIESAIDSITGIFGDD